MFGPDAEKPPNKTQNCPGVSVALTRVPATVFSEIVRWAVGTACPPTYV